MMDTQFFSTYILIAVTVIVSLVGFNDRNFMEKYLNSPYLMKHEGEWYRLFSHAFLHADAGHLIFNCITLFYFGKPLEEFFIFKYGDLGGELFFWFLVISSMALSSTISYFRNQNNPNYRSIGISGVTSTLVFGFIVLSPFSQLGLMFIPIPLPAWIFGLIYLGFEIYADRQKKSNIAHDAHISGAVYGIIIIFLTNIELVLENFKSINP
jgi:membrane associated rhomboid family serine protease